MPTKRILYISGSMGLGHIVRDLPIVAELRQQVPGVEVKWLAGEPAGTVLKAAGEPLLAEAALFSDDSAVVEGAASGMQLNLFNYQFRARQGWAKNVQAFKQAMERELFDLVVADEAYEIAMARGDSPFLRRCPFVMIYDFVGLDATTRNPLERLSVYYFNRVWSTVPHEELILFVGELEDIHDRPFGFLLPNRRQWAAQYCRPVGYILSFDPTQYSDTAQLRARLGYGLGPLVICSIGGTAIGKELLELCARAYPALKAKFPDLQLVLVCGPRLSPDLLQGIPQGVEIRGYVPALYEHFAASDLAIVQGGGTTTLELTALRRPFIFFPCEGDFEQESVVGGRLARHQAGIRMTFSRTTPQCLAEQIIAHIGRPVTYPSIPTDGAKRAAHLISELL